MIETILADVRCQLEAMDPEAFARDVVPVLLLIPAADAARDAETDDAGNVTVYPPPATMRGDAPTIGGD